MAPRPPIPGARVSSLTYAWGSPGTLWGGQQALASMDRAFDRSGLFSPNQPLVPMDAERVRTWDFPVGYNLIYTPRAYEETGFDDLRALAQYYLVAAAIETRKDQIEKFQWAIVPRDEDNPRSDAQKRIDALTEFWRHPDGETEFASWLRTALHDLLIIDAPAFEIRRTRGGDVIGLDIVDGATIKILVDDTGRRPRPPAPAYEQVIHGRPWRLLTTDELLYAPRNHRADHAYGFGPVEQVMMYINIGLRRAITQLNYYTSGNIPEGIIAAPEGWNSQEIKAAQEWFDGLLAGNLAERNKIIWTPGGKYQAFKSSPIERDFEEWLARVICYVFSLPPTALVNQVNRATGETMQEAAVSEGNQPLMAWTKRLADRVIQIHMGHEDLEFEWQTEDPLDPEDEATMLIGLVKEGIMTRNEAREVRGMEPVEGGDELACDTGSGPVLWKDVLNPPEPAPSGPGGAAAGGRNGSPPSPRPSAAAYSPQKKEAPAGKAAGPFGLGNARAPLRAAPGRNLALMQQAEARLRERLSSFFATRAADVAAQIARRLGKAATPEWDWGAPVSPRQWDFPLTGDWTFKPATCRTRAGPLAGRDRRTASAGRAAGNTRATLLARLGDSQAGMGRAGVRGKAISQSTSAFASLAKAPPGPDEARPVHPAAPDEDAAQRRAQEILAAVDLGDWSDVEDALADMAEVYGDGYVRGLRLLIEQTGAERPPAGEVGFGVSTEQVNERAVAWARQHAAERVTMIQDNTREMLNATVTQGIIEGWGAVKIGEEIADSAAFSDARSETIGRTEVITANNRGNLDAYVASDVVEQVEWLTAQDDLVEEICQENEDAGPVAIGEAFPSGDDAPPAHPNCRCALLPVTEPLDE